jgi:hypothetical protein
MGRWGCEPSGEAAVVEAAAEEAVMTDDDLTALGVAMQQAADVLVDIVVLGVRDLGGRDASASGGLRSGKSEAELRVIADRVAPVLVGFVRRQR